MLAPLPKGQGTTYQHKAEKMKLTLHDTDEKVVTTSNSYTELVGLLLIKAATEWTSFNQFQNALTQEIDLIVSQTGQCKDCN